MNLKNQLPVFVPRKHRLEIEKLSKAALMDLVWDYAVQIGAHQIDQSIPSHGENADGPAVDAAMAEFRARREIVLHHRAIAKDAEAA